MYNFKPQSIGGELFQEVPWILLCCTHRSRMAMWFSIPEASDPGVNFSLAPSSRCPLPLCASSLFPCPSFSPSPSPLLHLSQIKLGSIRRVILSWNICSSFEDYGTFPSSPDLSACTDVEVGCLSAVVNMRRGCNIYSPPREVSGPTCWQLQDHLQLS